MSETIASLMAELGFDPQEFLEGMKVAIDANAKMAESLGKLGEVFKKSEQPIKDSTVATTAFGVALGNLAAQKINDAAKSVKDFASGAVQTAATVERLAGVARFLGEGAGKTAQEIDKLAAALNKNGITTRQSYDSIIQMTKASLDLNKAVELGTVAQNYARSSGQNSSDTLMRLIHGIQTLQTETLRNVGVVLNLDTEYKKFADTINKNVTALTGQEKQQAVLNAVLREGNKVAGIYGVTNEYVSGKQQSLTRHQEEAARVIGEKFLPVLRIWIDLQTKFWDFAKEYPGLFIAIGTAATVGAAGIAAWTFATKTAIGLGIKNWIVSMFAPMTTLIGAWASWTAAIVASTLALAALTAAVIIFYAAIEIRAIRAALKNQLDADNEAIRRNTQTLNENRAAVMQFGKPAWLITDEDLKKVGDYSFALKNLTTTAFKMPGVTSTTISESVTALMKEFDMGDQKGNLASIKDVMEAIHSGGISTVAQLEKVVSKLKTLGPAGLAAANDLERSFAGMKKIFEFQESERGIENTKLGLQGLLSYLERTYATMVKSGSAGRVEMERYADAIKAAKDQLEAMGKTRADLEAARIHSEYALSARNKKEADNAEMSAGFGAAFGFAQIEAIEKQVKVFKALAAEGIEPTIEQYRDLTAKMDELEYKIPATSDDVEGLRVEFAKISGTAIASEFERITKGVDKLSQATALQISLQKLLSNEYTGKHGPAMAGSYRLNPVGTVMSGGFMQNLPKAPGQGPNGPQELWDMKLKAATVEAGKLAAQLDAAKNLMVALGISANSTLGILIGGLAAAAKSGADVAVSLGKAISVDSNGHKSFDIGKVDWSGLIQGLAGVVGAFKNATDSADGFKRALGGAMVGAKVGGQIGAMFGGEMGKAWGQAIGGAIGAIAGILRGAPEWSKAAKEIGANMGVTISESLAKEILKQSKDLKISVAAAGLLNITKIAEESKKDIRSMMDSVYKLMSAIKDGSVPAKEGMKALGDAFSAVRARAEELGIVGDQATASFLRNARYMHQMTAEMKAYSAEQVNLAVGGANKIADGLLKVFGSSATKETVEKWFKIYKDKYDALKKLGDDLTDQQREDMKQFQQLMNAQGDKLNAGKFGGSEGMGGMGKMAATLFMGAFNAAVAEEGWVKAVDAMKDGFGKLKEALGGDEQAEALLAPFERLSGYLENDVVRGLITVTDGVKDVITGLSNAGYMSEEQMAAATGLISEAYERMQAEGVLAQDALLAVAPALAAAISASQQYGIPLDEKTQALKDAAEAAGIQFPIDPLLQVRDILMSIATALGADIPESARKGAEATERSARESADANKNAAKESGDAWASEFSRAATETKEQWTDTGVQVGDILQATGDLAQGVFDDIAGSMDETAGKTGELTDGVNLLRGAIEQLHDKKVTIDVETRRSGDDGGDGGDSTDTGDPERRGKGNATGFFSESMPRGPLSDGGTPMVVHPGERVSIMPKGQVQTQTMTQQSGDGENVFHINISLPGGEVLKYVERATKNRQIRVHPDSVKRF